MIPEEVRWTIRRIRAAIHADRLPAAALSAYVDGDSTAQALDADLPDVSVQAD
jgi:hypothetical protein